MSRGTLSPIHSGQDLELEPCDIEVLAYIHSNKFITTKLFHQKFHSHQSYKTACLHLKRLELAGLLLKTQKLPNQDTYFWLSRPSLRYLYDLSRILISHEVRLAHINLPEREHDKRVLEMRIQIESDPLLEKMTWLSDYEMRCGVTMDWKKDLENGRGFGLEYNKLHRCHQRTPDGHFETTIEGVKYDFVLEYEHTPYSRQKISDMVLNLDSDFPNSYRLIVSRDSQHTLRIARGIFEYVKGNPQRISRWGFSFYEHVIYNPFTNAHWATLGDSYLPFVKLIAPEQEPTEDEPNEVNP